MMQAVELEFNRYRNPPDFEIVELHHDAAYVYDEKGEYENVCPCCLRKAGNKKIPICVNSATFLRISPQIPLYFSYIKVVIVVLFLFMAAIGVQRMFSESIEVVRFNFTPPKSSTFLMEIGFMQKRREVRFTFFLIFLTLILFVRGYLKKSKYEVNIISKKLSDRSVMLTNVKGSVKPEQILQKFNRYHIENVELTYKVKDYIENLQTVYKLKKACKLAIKKKKSEKQISIINKSLLEKTEQIKAIKNRIKSKENRLDFVFVTFRDEEDRKKFMKKHSTNLFWRLYFKFSTCCSNTAINGQHINVYPGPQPEDIDWLNLESSYWIKKVHRFACYYMSFSILIFGVLLQYEISTFPVDSLYISIIKNLIVFIGNFLVVNLLQFTTYQVEKHEMNTHKVLSLIKKLTFFVFLNLSMSPFSIYLYYEFSSTQVIDPTNTPFDQLCLSILIICIGNITKPLTQYLNVARMTKRISFYYQRYLGEDCEMTQEEANNEYEPIQFPLASFYSLLLSALFLTSFFLSSFQLIIVVQIFSCIILYIVSKYMLLRVCKQPIGLNHIISILCQKLIVLCIPFYWIGEKIMYFLYIKYPQGQSFKDYIYSLLQPYTIIEMSLIVFIFVFSSKLLSKISHKAITKRDITDSFIQRANVNQNKMTYADVNSIKQLQEELIKYIELESG